MDAALYPMKVTAINDVMSDKKNLRQTTLRSCLPGCWSAQCALELNGSWHRPNIQCVSSETMFGDRQERLLPVQSVTVHVDYGVLSTRFKGRGRVHPCGTWRYIFWPVFASVRSFTSDVYPPSFTSASFAEPLLHFQPITACSLYIRCRRTRCIVKATSQSNGNGQISTAMWLQSPSTDFDETWNI